MKTQSIAAILILKLVYLLAKANAQAQSAGVEARPKLAIQAGHTGLISHLAVSGDGKLIASVGNVNTVIVWNVETGGELLAIPSTSAVSDVAFHPTKPWLAIASDTLMIFDLMSGSPIFNHSYSSEWVGFTSVGFSKDGHWLAAGVSLGDIEIWDLDRLFNDPGTEHKTLMGHEGGVKTVAFSPDGSRLASWGVDKTVRIWDLARGTPPRKLRVFEQVSLVLFSPSGAELISIQSG